MSYGNSGGSMPNSGGPYSAGPQQPIPPKSNALWWILGIIGVLTVGGALVCCGGGYFAFRFSTQMVGEAVKESVANDAAIQEHIGTIRSVEMNLTATGAAGGGNKIVFDVNGDKGSGQLQVEMDNGRGDQAIKSCTLILPNGDKHEVKVETQSLEITPGEPVPVDPNATPAEPTLDEDAAKLESELLKTQTPEPATN